MAGSDARYAELGMLLPPGKTCADCAHEARCTMLFQVVLTNTWCDFAPSRFRQRLYTVDGDRQVEELGEAGA